MLKSSLYENHQNPATIADCAASNLSFKGAKLPFSKQNSQKVNLCSTFTAFHTGLHTSFL